MRKIIIVAILGIALAGLVYAFPWMMYQNQEMEGNNISPINILKSANVVEYTTPCGYEIYKLEVNGETVGVLWKYVDLNKLQIGNPFTTPFGERYPLYYNDELVGFIFINEDYNSVPPQHVENYVSCPCGCCCPCWQ